MFSIEKAHGLTYFAPIPNAKMKAIMKPTITIHNTASV
jgi:hypothetical protein